MTEFAQLVAGIGAIIIYAGAAAVLIGLVIHSRRS